jgi:hypothetical protein
MRPARLIGLLGGGSPAPGPALALLAEARIFVDWSDAANRSRRFARNQNAPVPSNNLVAFPTGPMVNESGSALPTRTPFTTLVTDPGGSNNAMRVQAPSANLTLIWARAGANGPAIPAVQLTMRFRARSAPGTGSHSISFGPTNSYTAGTTQDLDWTDPANEAATTFQATFTYNSSNDIAIRLNASGADIIIDRLQLYEGATAPAWSTEVFGGGRLPYAFENSLALDADENLNQAGVISGLQLIDPAFPAAHTYAGYTVMTVSSLDAIPSAATHIVNIHSNDGGASTGNVLQAESAAPYAGEVNASQGAFNSRSQHAANIAGQGVFIAGHGRSATQRAVWIDTCPQLLADLALTPALQIRRWTLAGWAATNIAGARTNLAPGRYCYTVIWDRLLTPGEWTAVANNLRARLASRSVAMMTLTDMHVISGDSNSTRATNDWTQLVTAAGYITGQRNLIAAITSVGGQGLEDLVNGINAEPPTVITTAGRYWLRDRPALLGGVENGRYALYHLPIGTNDWDWLESAGVATYVGWLQAFITAVLAEHPRIHVLWYSLLPQTATSRPNWETRRLQVNADMSAWIATQERVHLCDFGGSATIGDRATQAGGGGPYYLSDEIHFSSAGDVEAAAICRTAVMAWRTSLGIA